MKKECNPGILLLGRFDTPTYQLSEFLKKKFSNILNVRSRQETRKGAPSLFETEKSGEIKKFERPPIKHNGVLFHLRILLDTLFFVRKSFLFFWKNRKKTDWIIGVGPFNGFLAFLFRALKPRMRTVYYAEDRMKVGGGTMETLTKKFDSIATKKSTALWYMTDSLQKIQDPTIQKKSYVVSIPIFSAKKQEREKQTKNLIFIGDVSELQGCDMLYRVFHTVVSAHPQSTLTVIGTGDYEDVMKKNARKDGLEKNIQFKGFIKDHQQINQMIKHASIGLALYNPFVYQFLAFGQSSKIGNYIGRGIPVIVTGEGDNMPSLAPYIQKYQAGYALPYQEEVISQKIIELFEDDHRYTSMRQNTKKIAEIFSEENVYTPVIQTLCTTS